MSFNTFHDISDAAAATVSAVRRRHRATGAEPGEQVGMRQPPGRRNFHAKTCFPPDIPFIPPCVRCLLYIADSEAYCPGTTTSSFVGEGQTGALASQQEAPL